MRAPATGAWRAAASLGACVLLAVALLAGLHALTRDRIAGQQRRAQLDALRVVLPAALHDNDPLRDRIFVTAPQWLGGDAPMQVWRARLAGRDSALVLEAVAPEGYNGAIGLLLGVRADGSVSGVRVTSHRETPGLGDPIDASRSDWILGFDRRSLRDPPPERWRVRRDGGDFDQLAGATVTPRAIVHAVRRALAYLDRHGAELYAAAPGTTLEHRDAPQD